MADKKLERLFFLGDGKIRNIENQLFEVELLKFDIVLWNSNGIEFEEFIEENMHKDADAYFCEPYKVRSNKKGGTYLEVLYFKIKN